MTYPSEIRCTFISILCISKKKSHLMTTARRERSVNESKCQESCFGISSRYYPNVCFKRGLKTFQIQSQNM